MFGKLLLFNKLIRQHKSYSPATSQSWQYFSAWRKTLDKSKSSLDYGLPWFTFQAISFMEKNLKPGMKVFEYGGGSSTKYFIAKGAEVFTSEHHKGWFADLEKIFSAEKKWHGFLLEPGAGTRGNDPGDPLHYFSKDEMYSGNNFYDYASRIDAYPDQSFDMVLVDGRARPSCTYHAVPKIKKGGYLIIDNTERDYYSTYFQKHFAGQFELVLDTFGPVPYTLWFHKTSIWRRK